MTETLRAYLWMNEYLFTLTLNVSDALINWGGFAAIAKWIWGTVSDGYDLVAEEMKFGLVWNSTPTTNGSV